MGRTLRRLFGIRKSVPALDGPVPSAHRCRQLKAQREVAMTGRLEGKRAVITAAAQGIGRASAELFVARGRRR